MASNIRKKSIASWGRVWEVLCPICGKIRSLKNRPKRGILISRCHPCGIANITQLPWHWAIGYGGAAPKGSKKPHGAPCIIVRCGLCNEPRLVPTAIGMHGLLAHCRRCYIQCSQRWDHKPVSGDRRRGAAQKEKQ